MDVKIVILFAGALLSIGNCQKTEKEMVGPRATGSASGEKYVQASGGLRLRETPEVSGKVILTMPDGTATRLIAESGPEIEISGKKGKWTKVNYTGYEGWVFGGFLTDQKPQPDAPCVTSLTGFKQGCLGEFCRDSSRCSDDKRIFRSGGIYTAIYCDGGARGTWRVEGDEIIAVSETNMWEGEHCFDDACRAQSAKEYAGMVHKVTITISINSDGTVNESTKFERTGHAPALHTRVRKDCLLSSWD
ncbi:MAG: SH3 domain-containing protein [Spirochaetales bacterium]|nr:SH3 domain-containing protein [Spirochaetales bacterium]